MSKRCKIARNVEVDGVKYKIVDPRDACAALNRVLAKHEGVKVITPTGYARLTGRDA